MRLFFLSSFVFFMLPIAHGSDPSCGQGRSEPQLLMKLKALYNLSLMGTQNKTKNTFQIFKDSLACRHRLWETDSTRLGSKAVYFVEPKVRQACLYNTVDGHCVDNTSVFFNDPISSEAASDLLGYSVRPGGSGREEVLILNANSRDLIERQTRDPGNKALIASINKKSKDCLKFSSDRTLQLSPVSLPDPDDVHHVSGFCMHEYLHMYQRTWKQPPFDEFTYGKLQAEEERIGSAGRHEVVHLMERVAFHMLQYLYRVQEGEGLVAQKQLSLARAYFHKFKNKYPQSLHFLSNKNEGTATYVDIRAAVLSEKGCDLPEQELNREVTERLRKKAGQLILEKGASAYLLSALAFQTMQIAKIENWQNKVEQRAASPLEILFSELQTDDVQIPARAPGLELARCLETAW